MKSFPDYIKNELPKWPTWLNNILLHCNFFKGAVYGRGYAQMEKEIVNIDPEKKLLEMVNYAIRHVKYYRDHYGNLSINSIKEFEEKIGFIDKDEVMAHWSDFLVDNIDWSKCVTGTTGGTGGKPLKLVLPKNRYIHSLAFWHKQLKWFGWNYDARAVIRNHKLDANRKYIINPITKEFIFDAFRMSPQYAKEVWRVMYRNKIKFLHAYPSAAFQFLKFCYKQDLNLNFLKVCILTSEGITPEQHQFIQGTLGLKICASYGHSEKLIQAISAPDRDSLIVEEGYGYCEIIDKEGHVIREEGANGELVGTTFFNRYMPLIRYRTGDYAEYIRPKDNRYAPCRELKEVKGRWDKNIIFKGDGSTTSITALNMHSDLYEKIDGLQFIQKKKGELIVLIIKGENFDEETARDFSLFYQKVLGETTKIRIQYVEKLIFQPNGKFLPLISYVN